MDEPRQKAKRLEVTRYAKILDSVAATLDYVERFWREDRIHRLPILRQIAIGIGIPISTAHEHMSVLRQTGCIDDHDDITQLGVDTAQAWRDGRKASEFAGIPRK